MTLSDLKVPFVICDVGSNWKLTDNPSDNLVLAKRHIYDASKTGVNAVKFQFYSDKELYGFDGPNKYQLPANWIVDLAAYASEHGVEFMCTAFSPEGYDFINPFVNIHKVASSEMKHVEILKVLAGTNKPMLISTGGATEPEVQMISNMMLAMGKEPLKDFAFLECIAAYPAKVEDYNLRVLTHKHTLVRAHPNTEAVDELILCPYIGVSDHTTTHVLALTAIGLGATVFEKHFTSFPNQWGVDAHANYVNHETPDSPVSIGPKDLRMYVSEIRQAYKSLGDGRKLNHPTENDMLLRYRRRLKITQPVKFGQHLKFGKNFGIYRSIKEDTVAGPPEMWQSFENGIAKMDLNPGDPVWVTTVDRP